jgi:mono/diheme cytochrome c family protein
MGATRLRLALIAGACWSGVAQGQTAPPERTLWDSAYTAQQAARGDTVFHASCAACHATSQFTGRDFLAAWDGGTVQQLVRLIGNQMPYDNPGSLPRDQYLSVVAYLFRLNGFPAGIRPLPSDSTELKRLHITSHPEHR